MLGLYSKWVGIAAVQGREDSRSMVLVSFLPRYLI